MAAAVLLPLYQASTLFQQIMKAEAREPDLREFPGWVQYKLAMWLVTLGIVVWRMWVAYNLKTKLVPRSVYLAKLYLAASPFIAVPADVVSSSLLLNLSPGPEAFVSLGVSILFSGAWYVYFSRSTRVHHTYLAAELPTGPQVTESSEFDNGALLEPLAAAPGEHLTSVAEPGVAGEPASFAMATSPGFDSLEAKLESLKRLLVKGLISAEDYERKKAELLSQF
jgi:hypothetical protein